MWLYVAVVIHSAGLTRFNYVGFAFTWHGVHVTGLAYTIITITRMIHKRMVDTV